MEDVNTEEKLRAALETHPCYSEEAHTKFARMHLPVAPKCNIQCNYCNRKYDCSNESRPGVTSEVLSPEAAMDRVGTVLEKIPHLKVLGIAGPGDPLANEETFKTLRLMKERYPELTACVSTNGLALPERAEELYGLGVRFITVTMNALNPETGGQIYGSVRWKGERLTGKAAAERLIGNQKEGIRICAGLGMVVKVNTVMIPGINDGEIPELVREVKKLGAYTVNILPLIPVEGTPFAERKAPTPKERKDLMDKCSGYAKVMRHCKQCRADAVGLLGEDRSSEFAKPCGSGCGPTEPSEPVSMPADVLRPDEIFVAVATSDGKNADCGFGNAPMFRIFASDGRKARFVRDVEVKRDTETAGPEHRGRIGHLADLLKDCRAVAVSEIGHMPKSVLSSRGMAVTVTEGPAEKAAKDAAEAILLS